MKALLKPVVYYPSSFMFTGRVKPNGDQQRRPINKKEFDEFLTANKN